MLCFWEDLEQGLGVPVSHRKERAGAWFGGSRACSLRLFSALPSLTCEVSLTKVNSKVLRSSQLVSAGEGRNSARWALALGCPKDLFQHIPKAGRCCKAPARLWAPCCAQCFTCSVHRQGVV